MTAGARLKVAYFVPPSRHFAGIERVVHELASGLAERHPRLLEVHVIFASHYDEEVLRETRYTIHVLGVDRLRQLAASLRRCVATEQFDVLVTPQVEASVVAWTVTRGLRLPVLLPHLHGNPKLEEAEGTRRTKASFAVFRSLVTRDVPAVLAVSPSLRDYAGSTLARRTRTVFAKNPVRDLGSPEPTPRADDRFRFVSVARLCRQKGQDILLRGLALARPDLPHVQLTLVGNGPDEEALRRLSVELGVDDVVTFAGYSPDPVGYLRRADCFVLASRWEGFGVALVEALQCGLPLLATDCDFGPADVITDAEIGELVAPESPEAMAEGLRHAVRRPRTAAGDARRREVAAAYLPVEAVESHFSILSSVAPTG